MKDDEVIMSHSVCLHCLIWVSYVSHCFSSNNKPRLTRRLPVKFSVSNGNLLHLVFLIFSVSSQNVCFVHVVLAKSLEQIKEDTANIRGAVESCSTCTCTTFGNKRATDFTVRFYHLTLFWQVSWINPVERPQKHNRFEPFGLWPCATSTNSSTCCSTNYYFLNYGIKHRPAGWSITVVCPPAAPCLATKKTKHNVSIARGIWSSPLAFGLARSNFKLVDK